MKRVLLFAGLLLGYITTASAVELTNQKSSQNATIIKSKRYAQPIIFLERGVEFLVFPDGSFDFNTNVRNVFYNYRHKNRRRASTNSIYRGPNTGLHSFNKNRGVIISRDRNGNVRRIGNVHLNYDRFGRITRAGSVFIDYSRGRRHSSVIQVGGLSVDYNRWGEILYTQGQVHRFHDDYCNICGIQSCDITHNFRRGKKYKKHNRHHDDDRYEYRNDNDDDEYYYYKRNGKVKKQKRKR